MNVTGVGNGFRELGLLSDSKIEAVHEKETNLWVAATTDINYTIKFDGKYVFIYDGNISNSRRLKKLLGTIEYEDTCDGTLNAYDIIKETPLGSTGGGIKYRIRNLMKYRVPWAWADRMLLFGPLAVGIAKAMGVNLVTFGQYCPSIYQRTAKFTTEQPGIDGIKVVR